MDKSFETLYKICMAMADIAITDQTVPARFTKLEEEYQEMIAEFKELMEGQKPLDHATITDYHNFQKERLEAILDEMADVLFVLLHAAHKLDHSAKDLLHRAALKMFTRLNDPNYRAKEQRNI